MSIFDFAVRCYLLNFFPTLEPGPVADFNVILRGSHYLQVRWAPPTEPNGNITGYDIYYQECKLTQVS